jgi:Ricin-type beta-trefoil lectin domain
MKTSPFAIAIAVLGTSVAACGDAPSGAPFESENAPPPVTSSSPSAPSAPPPVRSAAFAGHGLQAGPGPVRVFDAAIPDELKQLTEGAASIGAIYSGVGTALQTLQALLSAAGVLTNDTEVLKQQLQALSNKLDFIAGALSWQFSEAERENHFADSLFDVTDAAEQARLGTSFTPNSPSAANSGRNAFDALTDNKFKRLFSEAATNGDGQWKNFMWQRPQVDNGFVYDWRLGVPMMMQLISLRLQVIAALDQNFTRDHVFDQELGVYRAALQTQMQKIKDGVQCNTIRIDPSDPYTTTWSLTFQVTCADLYTGSSRMGSQWGDPNQTWPNAAGRCIYYRPSDDGASGSWVTDVACVENDPEYKAWYQANVGAMEDSFKLQIIQATPAFQMQRMIDTLYLYMHPQADLTQTFQRIALQQNYGLCLDVQWGNSASGTPVWLWNCNAGSAQHWVYDRQHATIVNPVFNKCLDVQWGANTPGTPVWIWDCNGGDSQKWTYDPEQHVLQNALGTALDVQGGVLQRGTPVLTAPRNGGPPQQWYADQPSHIIRNF